MNYFNYFKYFNQVNKLNNFIRNDLNCINYDDLILDYIFETRNLELAKIIIPMIENKKSLTRSFYFFHKVADMETEIEWFELIIKNGLEKITSNDEKAEIYSSEDNLIKILKCVDEDHFIKNLENKSLHFYLNNLNFRESSKILMWNHYDSETRIINYIAIVNENIFMYIMTVKHPN